MTAIIKAVDEYQDLLRMSVASAGNDHRLGANEAPPAIISMFLGDELTSILESLENRKKYNAKAVSRIEIGVDTLPYFPKDTTDRNRTSPFAFTGNKFEFRMPGSSSSISGANIVINTIVADALKEFAETLEKAEDFNAELNTLISETIKKHKRIIFNGNNYSDEWTQEAKKRGLLNMKSTVEALPCFTHKKNVELFARHGIFTENEVHSRQEIMFENYCKIIHIEALTVLDMVKRDIIPAVVTFSKELAELMNGKKALGIELDCALEQNLLTKVSSLSASMYNKINALEIAVLEASKDRYCYETAAHYHDDVFLSMQTLRSVVDELETLVAKKYWPYPSYGEILYSVN